MRIKILQNYIDFLRKKNKKEYNYFLQIHESIFKNIQNLKRKIKEKQKIKVAFLFMYATDCQNLSIFEKMLKRDDIFDPYFIVNPDISRSKENFDYNYNRSKDELVKKYGQNRVLDGYDYNTNTYKDYSSEFDMATTNNPYDIMAHEFYKVSYWAKKQIPVFYISYFYMGRCFVGIENLKSREFSYFWKIFAENKYVLKLAKQHEIIKGKNIVISGSPKMDKLASIIPQEKSKKIVIIAPHHSIDNDEKSVGGFLQYSDILLSLPKKYPQINFVFRPHPLLFENLRTKYWGAERSDKYLSELLSNDNVCYSTEGDYLELFAKSDALIHDCGSFCAEYLYTNKPCAYLYKKGINPKAIWTSFGKKCINQHYVVKTSKDIQNFINDVVLKENDYKKLSRNKYIKKYIAIKYPYSSDFILNEIIRSFGYEHKH